MVLSDGKTIERFLVVNKVRLASKQKVSYIRADLIWIMSQKRITIE